MVSMSGSHQRNNMNKDFNMTTLADMSRALRLHFLSQAN